LEVAEKFSNIGQRKAERLQTVDPPKTSQRVVIVKAMAALRPESWAQQTHAFVKPHGTGAPLRTLRQIANSKCTTFRNFN
ncbi:MAG: hypothetical protein AAFV29_23930, partial [Myxococcota bacterium]